MLSFRVQNQYQHSIAGLYIGNSMAVACVSKSEEHALLCDRCDSIIENLVTQCQVSQTEDSSYQPTT